MAELGSGNGTGYPGALDTDNVLEVDSPNAGKTKARADVPNDLAAAVIAVETELGTDPAGTLANVKTYLQTEHATNGTHDAAKVAMLAGTQDHTGAKTFSGGVTATADVEMTDAVVIQDIGADVASATNLVVLGDGNIYDVTGTTTIATIATLGIGTVITLHFADALILTHSADLDLIGAANVTTAAGDVAVFYEYAAADWRMISFSQPLVALPASSTPSFRAKPAAATLNLSTLKLIDFETEVWDTNSDYVAGSSSFIPTVAGKYLLTFQIQLDNTGGTDTIQLAIKKNGATADGAIANYIESLTTATYSLTVVVDANGVDDNFEAYALDSTTGTADTTITQDLNFFCGAKVG